MSDLRIQSTAPMSIDPDLEDPANAMSRADESAPTGARGRAGYSEGGASSVSTAPERQESQECLAPALSAAGGCGVAVVAAGTTAGVGAVFAGIACVGATLALLDCLEGKPVSHSQNAR